MSADRNPTGGDGYVVTIPTRLTDRLRAGILNGTLLAAAEDLAYATHDPAFAGSQRLANVRAKLAHAETATELLERLNAAMGDHEEDSDPVLRAQKPHLLILGGRIRFELEWLTDDLERVDAERNLDETKARVADWRTLVTHLDEVTR